MFVLLLLLFVVGELLLLLFDCLILFVCLFVYVDMKSSITAVQGITRMLDCLDFLIHVVAWLGR